MNEIIFENPWIKVRKTPKGYTYSERRGVNSLAILLYRKTETGIEILIRHQPLPIDPTDELLFPCPITGSIPEGTSIGELEVVVVEEIEEEAGINVSRADLNYVGLYFVGTQTNETVHMYIVDVTGKESKDPKGDGSYHESLSRNEWIPFTDSDIDDLDADYSGLIILISKLKEHLKCQ